MGSGVLEALLRRVEASGWVIDRATRWKQIRKFEAGAALRGAGDDRSVQRLVLHAYEAGCEVVAFSRDRDSEAGREEMIERGIAAAKRDYPGVGVIGGTAWPCIEGWVLALAGVKRTDEMSRPRCDRELELRSIRSGHGAVEAFVEIVGAADLSSLPGGCESLVMWLERAREVLPRAIRGGASEGP